MWVIDIRHWLNKSLDGPGVPQLKSKVKKLTEIIDFATSSDGNLSVGEPPKCWRRPKRKPCAGNLELQLNGDEIHWLCPVCEDEGVVRGWQGLMWDKSDHRASVSSDEARKTFVGRALR